MSERVQRVVIQRENQGRREREIGVTVSRVVEGSPKYG